MKTKISPISLAVRTALSLAVAGSVTSQAASVVPYTNDAHTILLDHFDSSTSGAIKAFSYDGQPCGSPPPAAIPNYGFDEGPAGLGQCLNLCTPTNVPPRSGSYVEYPGGQLLSVPTGTLEFWVNPSRWDVTLGNQGPYMGSCNGWTFGMWIASNGALFSSFWPPLNVDSGQTVVPTNAWTHVALTWGSSGAKLYLNGKVTGTNPATGMPASGFDGVLRLYSGAVGAATAVRYDELRISDIERTNFNLANSFIGTYTVNYRYNAAGRYTDQSHTDFTMANPYYGNVIPPGPIFVNATPGRYKVVVDAQNGLSGCSIWSGDASSGKWYWSANPFVEFDHQFGQIAFYAWDWYAGDNDPSQQVTVSLYAYGLQGQLATNITLTPINPVISTVQAQQFTATGTFSDGSSRPLSVADNSEWSSSNPLVATVDANGLAVPLAQGYTTIKVCKDGACTTTTLFITNQPPTVVKPPMDQAVRPGSDVTWCVVARGSQPMTYQWQFNGTDIAGATGNCLNLPGADPATAGLYSLVIANPFGTNTLQAALSLVDLKMFAGLIIAGPPGNYRIEAMDSLGGTNTWTILGTNQVTAQQMPFYYFDTNSPSHTKRFYRSIWMP